MAGGTDWLGRLLTWVVMVVLAIVAIRLTLWLAGTLVGLLMFLAFTVLPLALVGWVIVKLWRLFRRDDEYRPA